MEELITPRFLLAEEPIKDKSNSMPNRLWIYAPFCLSLVELICLDDVNFIPFENERLSKEYLYTPLEGKPERWLLVFIQDNTPMVDLISENLLDEIWEWYTEYLMWEDANF